MKFKLKKSDVESVMRDYNLKELQKEIKYREEVIKELREVEIVWLYAKIDGYDLSPNVVEGIDYTKSQLKEAIDDKEKSGDKKSVKILQKTLALKEFIEEFMKG